MADFFQRITEMQGTLEDLVRKVPGFKGYLAKEDRRAADRLLREHLVRVFEEQLNEFNRLQKRMIDVGGIMYMELAQGITGQLQTFIDRVESAAEGYSGLFDPVKVKEEELDRLYAFDNGLLIYEGQLQDGLEALRGAIGGEGVRDVLYSLDELVAEANDTFKRRSEAIVAITPDE